jgi:3-isopropylmalate dehydrogenase
VIHDPEVLRLTVLPGDGIGPEVTEAALRVLGTAVRSAGISLEASSHLIGGAALDAAGDPLPEASLRAALAADAVFLGAVGGPAWDSAPVRPEAGLLRLRAGLGAFANLRPVRVWPGLERFSPLRPEVIHRTDVLFIRELTGGLYFGRPKGRTGEAPRRHAVDTCEYSESEIRRVAQVAFRAARGRRRQVTSVDKANVLATSQLWREVVTEVGADFADVRLDHCLVDTFALRLMQDPPAFDVVLTENLFGDILTDEAGALTGSLGMLPSASGGGEGPWLYEPVHGSAPDIAGQGRANPLGAIATVALLLSLTLNRDDLADRVTEAIAAVVAEGRLTPDLGGSASTESVTEAVLQRLPAGAPA